MIYVEWEKNETHEFVGHVSLAELFFSLCSKEKDGCGLFDNFFVETYTTIDQFDEAQSLRLPLFIVSINCSSNFI